MKLSADVINSAIMYLRTVIELSINEIRLRYWNEICKSTCNLLADAQPAVLSAS